MLVQLPARLTLSDDDPPLDTAAEFRAEQLEVLRNQAHAGTMTFVTNAAILGAVLWPTVSHRRLMAWYGLVLLLAAIRLMLVVVYGRQPRANRLQRRWFGYVLAGSLAAGIAWGVAGTFLVPADSYIHQAFLGFLLAGTVAGAVPLLSAIWEVYVAYAIPALLPFILWLFWHGDGLHRYMGVLVGIFLVVMLVSSRRYYVMVSETLRLRLENEKLQRGLHDAQVHAEVASEELRAEMADRRKAQAALWQSEARFQRLIDQAADAFFLIDVTGRVCEVNQPACDSLGYTYEELVRASIQDLFEDLELPRVEEAWQKLGAGKPLTMELINRRKDGSTFPVEVRVSLFDTEEGRFILALARDISERKKVERLKNEFISTVSHELRTPLTCIHASLAVLKREQLEPLPAASKEMVDIAYKNGEQLIMLINDLLDVQKIESGMMDFRFEVVAIEPLVEEAVATYGALAEREGILLNLAASDPAATVWADRGRLMQVVGNLLSNAIKFSQPGDTVDLAVMRAGEAVRVEVRDRGIGIAEDFRDKVFQKFTQADASNVRRKGGTGLGLSICQMILERLQGRIDFESEVGRGSTFWFELPQYRG